MITSESPDQHTQPSRKARFAFSPSFPSQCSLIRPLWCRRHIAISSQRQTHPVGFSGLSRHLPDCVTGDRAELFESLKTEILPCSLGRLRGLHRRQNFGELLLAHQTLAISLRVHEFIVHRHFQPAGCGWRRRDGHVDAVCSKLVCDRRGDGACLRPIPSPTAMDDVDVHLVVGSSRGKRTRRNGTFRKRKRHTWRHGSHRTAVDRRCQTRHSSSQDRQQSRSSTNATQQSKIQR